MYRIMSASKDAYITNKVINNSFTASDANTGQAGTLDLYKLFNESKLVGQDSVTELTRALVKFDLSPLRRQMNDDLNINDSTFSCELKLHDVYGGQTTPSNFKMIVFPLAQNFDEGTGRDIVRYSDLGSTNYITASQYFDSEENQYLNNYYGLEEDHRTSTLDFEAEYIQQEETAILLRNFLLSWYANQHNIINIDLPLQYIKYEVGDIVEFDGLINNLKLYGEDYTRPNNRNGQDIYPYFMVMQTVKNINKITFKLVQLHKNLPIEQQEQIESDLNTIGGKIPLEQEMDTVLLKSPNLVSAEDIMPRTETQDDDGQDTGGSGY